MGTPLTILHALVAMVGASASKVEPKVLPTAYRRWGLDTRLGTPDGRQAECMEGFVAQGDLLPPAATKDEVTYSKSLSGLTDWKQEVVYPDFQTDGRSWSFAGATADASEVAVRDSRVVIVDDFLDADEIKAATDQIRSLQWLRAKTDLRTQAKQQTFVVDTPASIAERIRATINSAAGHDVPTRAEQSAPMLQRRLHARAMLGDTPPHYDEPQEASHLGAEVQNAYRNGYVAIVYLEGNGALVLGDGSDGTPPQEVAVKPGRLIAWSNRAFVHSAYGSKSSSRMLIGPLVIIPGSDAPLLLGGAYCGIFCNPIVFWLVLIAIPPCIVMWIMCWAVPLLLLCVKKGQNPNASIWNVVGFCCCCFCPGDDCARGPRCNKTVLNDAQEARGWGIFMVCTTFWPILLINAGDVHFRPFCQTVGYCSVLVYLCHFWLQIGGNAEQTPRYKYLAILVINLAVMLIRFGVMIAGFCIAASELIAGFCMVWIPPFFPEIWFCYYLHRCVIDYHGTRTAAVPLDIELTSVPVVAVATPVAKRKVDVEGGSAKLLDAAEN